MSLEVKPTTSEQAVLHTKLKPCIVEQISSFKC